jgi:hypothetical protein
VVFETVFKSKIEKKNLPKNFHSNNFNSVVIQKYFPNTVITASFVVLETPSSRKWQKSPNFSGFVLLDTHDST